MLPMIALETIASGEVQGGTTAVQMPDIPCAFIKIKALSTNATNVYIGSSADMTLPNGVTDETTGYELDAGDALDWIPISNLNKLWMRTDANADGVSYIAFK